MCRFPAETFHADAKRIRNSSLLWLKESSGIFFGCKVFHSVETPFSFFLHHGEILPHYLSITPTLLSSRRLQAIEQERSPQVLAIQHGDEEEGREDHSEDDDSAGVGTDSADEEEERDEDSSGTGSPDSPVDSPSPGEFALLFALLQ